MSAAGSSPATFTTSLPPKGRHCASRPQPAPRTEPTRRAARRHRAPRPGKFPANREFFPSGAGLIAVFSMSDRGLACRKAGFPARRTEKVAGPNCEGRGTEQGIAGARCHALLAHREGRTMPYNCGNFRVVHTAGLMKMIEPRSNGSGSRGRYRTGRAQPSRKFRFPPIRLTWRGGDEDEHRPHPDDPYRQPAAPARAARAAGGEGPGRALRRRGAGAADPRGGVRDRAPPGRGRRRRHQ